MLNKIFIKIIIFYRKFISPQLGLGKCKYHPTCSSYAIECFTRYGFVKAFFKSLWRILRCNPFSKGGYDPVK
ncbi:membrane protein insertion efficiency factor YidD [Anaerococcus sp. Marseille-P9784]|uniref:membrane protein insertion efficiency factor YidD n=1 Tax=Anaerococcus sp. Marseille-P9784 TaxID=2614127 RepID=UPI00124A80E0|nr:membrane protein insertion efficiency factor YidD [Anaerococcus sp. Marseille-P9784]